MTLGLPDQPCYHLRGERGVTSKIKQAMQETAKQFVYIGFLLWEVKQYEYFYEEGYGSIYEYAEQELGFSRSSTKNFIAICENFCRKNEHYETLPTMFLDDRWSDYQYSQLTEMLSMSPKQRQETTIAVTINNYWTDLSADIIRRLLKTANVKYIPRTSYRINISYKSVNE